MQKRLWLFFVLIPLLGAGQNNLLPSLLKTTPSANTDLINEKVVDFISLQQTKQAKSKSEIKFLHSLFNESHRKFLKHYKPYSQFNEPFESGHYDCLSGTAFFSLMLESLQMNYKIIETNYHIFLLVETHEGQVLLETTDRLFGFKTNPLEIDKCLKDYKENLLTASSGKMHYYQFQSRLFREVKSTQLSGLLYFNQAVVAYNNREWVQCVYHLEKARFIYDNARVSELTQLLVETISHVELNENSRQELLIQLSPFVTDLPVVAGR
ncbi:MAG: hypothetical protein IM574_00400 [Cytophagales bacterium]|jgi:hypothetical protein|nr:hypothetical protein [Cytophagales bacterium]MCA6388693.1 hypothetical protein [Cytophagales bacterium]MCA6392705.1 hypothetical protein [Cytophagales bacterium]MCA6395304.1 hypothetical protein [Cytophagales bacterium]MCA6400370.1 hypothetical protein [Cytophagales bacterium]